MSLILKGIDLPNCSNEDCIVVIRKDKAEVWQTGFKERTVEAIQIPKGHGSIIDSKDILTPVYCIPKTIGLTDRAQEKIVEIIENAPSLLEEDE